MLLVSVCFYIHELNVLQRLCEAEFIAGAINPKTNVSTRHTHTETRVRFLLRKQMTRVPNGLFLKSLRQLCRKVTAVQLFARAPESARRSVSGSTGQCTEGKARRSVDASASGFCNCPWLTTLFLRIYFESFFVNRPIALIGAANRHIVTVAPLKASVRRRPNLCRSSAWRGVSNGCVIGAPAPAPRLAFNVHPVENAGRAVNKLLLPRWFSASNVFISC